MNIIIKCKSYDYVDQTQTLLHCIYCMLVSLATNQFSRYHPLLAILYRVTGKPNIATCSLPVYASWYV